MMAATSRRSTDVFIPRKWNEQSDQPSPERTVIWSEQPKFSSAGDDKVPVVYYLTRNGQLDHPHFLQVPLSSSHGLFLRDVLNKLNFVRGDGIAFMYSWSFKRSYKNGYVWQDLSEDDLIYPTNDHDYILKGSELLQKSPTVPRSVQAHDSSNVGSGRSRKKTHQSWSHTHTFEESNPSSKKDNDSDERYLRVYRSESSRELGGAKSADMATETEEPAAKIKGLREVVYVNNSVELSREDLSPPSMSSSEGLDGAARGSGDAVARSPSRLDPAAQDQSSGGGLKPSGFFMQLISCGSSATVKDRRPTKRRGYSKGFKCENSVLHDVVER